MKERIPLQIVEGKLTLTAVVDCPKLRVRRKFMAFIIDTGSSNSYISEIDVRKLQIPLKGQASEGEVDFGGSIFEQISLPRFDMYLLKEDKNKNDYVQLNVSIYALKTTKSSQKKAQIAYTLPSILGMDFLKEQKLSLHVVLTENMAYLQYEG